QGRSLASGEEALVPAAMVYLDAAWAPEVRFTPMMSTGTVCTRSFAGGRIKAILEVIERFRLVAAWNHSGFGRRLPLGLLPASHTEFVNRLGRGRITLVLRALARPPAVPVVVALLAGPHFPWVALGSAAGLSIDHAAAKAAEEAAHAYQELSTWKGELPAPRTLPPVAPAQQHMLLWATRRRSRSLIESLSADRPVSQPSTDQVQAEDVVRELIALCPDAVEVVLTPPDCRLCGMQVLKVVAPGLPTLSFGSAGAPARHLAAHGIRRTRKLHPFG
ncbi:MAG: YcaO-like family protein, partial [Acidobacteria bacterium]|nr:YcaO-like family protein [Acidobacteriota bacterium]